MATISGKWKFNNDVTRGDDTVVFDANFSLSIHPNTTFVRFYWGNATNKVYLYMSDDSDTYIYGSQLVNEIIDFGATEQTISDDVFAWVTARAVQQTTITYNGVSTLIGVAETATLECKGKTMKSDVIVRFAYDGSITYNGTQTDVEAENTATLECNGKKMVDNVVVSLYAADTDELAGTWIFNDSLSFSSVASSEIPVNCDILLNGTFFTVLDMSGTLGQKNMNHIYVPYNGDAFFAINSNYGYPQSQTYVNDGTSYYRYNKSAQLYYNGPTLKPGETSYTELRTITITSTYAEAVAKNNESKMKMFMTLLKSNATKVRVSA